MANIYVNVKQLTTIDNVHKYFKYFAQLNANLVGC